MLQYTQHAATRSAQRGLSEDEIEYVYQFASRYHQGGALIYFLRRNDVPPPDRGRDYAHRLIGTALVCDPDSVVLLTAWRNRRKGLKRIRRKEEYHYQDVRW